MAASLVETNMEPSLLLRPCADRGYFAIAAPNSIGSSLNPIDAGCVKTSKNRGGVEKSA